MTETAALIAGLAAATFGVRWAGYLLGRRLPQRGPWARRLKALPGCMVTALVVVLLAQGDAAEQLAAACAAAVALTTRNLPLTMIVGVAAVALLRGSF